MFKGFTEKTIDFMWGLRLNNQKSWFEEHKEVFKSDFQMPMKQLAAEVFARISANYGDRGFIYKVSRIYRDARRIRGGEPYRDNLWFTIEKPSEQWTSTPVFWFELAPENWSYGLGYYHAKSETMAKFRARLDQRPHTFEKLIEPLARQTEFVLVGDEYVRKKVAPTENTALWYNRKSFSLIHRQEIGAELFTADLVGRIESGFRFLMPLYDYFITLDLDPSPK